MSENSTTTTVTKRPQFGVNTKEMAATLPLLPAGDYAAEVYACGINEKYPITIELETIFVDKKPTTSTDFILVTPFNMGFIYRLKLLSEKAIKLLGRDKPKFSPNRGIRLDFHKYGTMGTDEEGNPVDLSYRWQGSPVLKELLNVLGLGEENYSTLVHEEWVDDLEFLLDRLGFDNEKVKNLKLGMSDEQLLVAANAINYYRSYFDVMAKDIIGKLCKVIIVQSKIPEYPSKMENNVYQGSFKNPSCGLLEYTSGCENDL